MREYIFSVYYYSSEPRLIKVKAHTRAKAYELARAKAIRIKNDLDFVELN
jgi:hypothetical protein